MAISIISGKNGKVSLNASVNGMIGINSDHIVMEGVEQNSSGGVILSNASESLNQTNNQMNATDGGKIINQSDGQLNQINNEMVAVNKGEIHNILKKD